MKDGRLNKCATCVVKEVAEWRNKNPKARAKEYAKVRIKKGFKTRQEYLTARKENAKGRQVALSKYTHKRRLQTTTHRMTELDELCFTEAVCLREQRKKLTGFDWHIDHIIPLNHKLACGLHNAFNWQVVPAAWNIRKSKTHMKQFFISGY